MFASAEDDRPGSSGIAPDAFEHRASVAGYVRKNMDLRIVPANQTPIVPNFFGGLDHDKIISCGTLCCSISMACWPIRSLFITPVGAIFCVPTESNWSGR